MKKSLMIISLIVCFIHSANATSVQGIVSDSSSGEPVSDARLIAFTFTENGDSLVFEVTSGSSGEYFFGDLPNGIYSLRCAHSEYVDQTRRNIQITAADLALYMHFKLKKKSAYWDTFVGGHVYSVPEMLPAFIPIEGATVVLSGEVIRFSATTDENGAYHFRNIPPGWYFLSTYAPDHSPQFYIDTIFVEKHKPIDDLDIYLKPYSTNPAALSGTVYQADSNLPVYPAKLLLSAVHSGITDSVYYETQNNPDGSYRFDSVRPGFYRLECRARGFQTFVEPTLDLTKNDIIFDIHMLPKDPPIENYIGGVVINTLTELPVYHAQVNLVSIVPPGMAMPSVLYTTYTDEWGRFSFSSIPPWKYQLTAWADGFEISEAETLVIEEDTQIRNLRLGIKPINTSHPVTLKGHVFGDSADPEPVYPAEIYLLRSTAEGESVTYKTVTNPDGSYSIEDIKPSNYTIICRATGYKEKVINNLNLYTDTRLNFYLERVFSQIRGYLSGHVYFDNTNLPVKGAVLTFFSTTSYTPMNYHTTTDSTGFYRAGLPAGTYFVSCSYARVSPNVTDYYSYQEFYDDVHSIADATPVGVRPNQETYGIDFGIPQLPSILEIHFSGRVTDDQNIPINKALVHVWTLHPTRISNASYCEYKTWTREDGTYEMTIRLPAWRARYGFIVSAQKIGYLPEFYKEKRVPYLADILWAWSDTSFKDIDFTLEPVGNMFSISGLVSDESGNTISDAFVIGFRKSTCDVVFTSTDNSGKYTLPHLYEDYYYILFLAHGFAPEFFDDAMSWEDATPVYVSHNISGIDAQLTPITDALANGIIAGRIFNSLEEPIPGVVVTACNTSGIVVSASFSDASGYYELSNIPAGTHVLRATKINYPTISKDLQVDGFEANMTMFNLNMGETISEIEEEAKALPETMSLLPNYPNPFNPKTTIQFSVPERQQVRLTIYNILGQPVQTLYDGVLEAGIYTTTWNGTDFSGSIVASGLYFMALESANSRVVKKMILSK